MRLDLGRTHDGAHAAAVEVGVGRRFRVDAAGQVAFGFGKHRVRRLADVARTDAGSLRWMLGQSFLDDAQALVGRALAGPTVGDPAPPEG